MHYDDKIDQITNKPEIILDYNSTKAGVDCVDKLSGINAFVLFSANNVSKIRRRLFLRALSFQLVENHIRRRAMQSIPRVMVLRIKEVLGLETPIPKPVPVGQRCIDRGPRAVCGPPVEYWWPADSKNNTLVHSKNIEFYSRIKPKSMFEK
ncbi:hypothetical protein QE152_g30955 [Popillia japonica]|uniref:Uncharacterized protein n=1 Tax=Popillia japonica TaxID=7064 RepID=A0AAW1JD66_POPJA